MTSRERENSTSGQASQDAIESKFNKSAASRRRQRRKSNSRELRRKQLFETLEQRQLLAGPQLIGVQPNEGELIVDGSVRDTAPRSLTFRFDQDQQIDTNTLDAIQITRSGSDRRFGTEDDQVVPVGSVELGALADNEVVVRFADSLPDDRYRIDVFGFDAPSRGIVGLRNTEGQLLVARDGVSDNERIEFELRLGAKVEAIVPQPVVRLSDRSLEQRRNEIIVYFNDDDLFVENDPDTGLPTERSAENPRFYQLLLTQDTVRTTDDAFYQPDRVIYDAETDTARLIFADDLNQLPGVSKGGGTFRLRIGTAVDTAADLVVTPTELNVVPRVSSNLGAAAGLDVEFSSKVFGENAGQREIQFTDSGNGGLSVSLDAGGNVVYDFGGATVTVQALRTVTANEPTVDAVLAVNFSFNDIAGAGATTQLPSTLAGTTLRMTAAGDMLTTATDIGILGANNSLLTSVLISESIDPKPYDVQLPGAVTDPGRADPGTAIANAVNDQFGPDSTDGITQVEYNFQGIFAGGVGTGIPAQLNNITEVQKRRVREAINLWSNYLGVQFIETADSGVTFALGTTSELTPVAGTDLRSVEVLDAALRIDPTFTDAAIVFSNQASFDLDYGEDFFRKAMAGIGLLLGLEQNGDVTAQTLMALDPEFLNAGINPDSFISPIDPFFEIQSSLTQSINPAIDSQSINEPLPNALEGQEPVFPGRQDILHGQHIHRPDSVDVDLYRFEVQLDAGREFGTLTVESFAERLADSSLLDTTLTLFEDVSASAVTNFGLGSDVSVRIDSQLPGDMGNRSRIEFIQTNRSVGDTDVRVDRIAADNGELIENAIRVDLPRRGPAITSLTVSEVIDAIHNDPFASTLFELSIVDGDGSEDLIDAPLSSFNPIRLADGGTVPLTRNDDYFSEDSLLTAQLSNGVYYIGVAASGNDTYDPALEGSAVGGRTQGEYELLVKFEPQVSQTDVIRDLDSDRIGVPGTAIDGDLDGRPSGVKNFWFQTRPQERVLEVVSSGSGLVAGETITITAADGATRRFEFIPFGQNASPGNIPVRFSPLNTISDVTVNLAAAINTNGAVLGISATPEVDANDPNAPAFLVLSGERAVSFSADFQGINALGRTLFVDKIATVVADGSLDQPFNNINGIAGNGAFTSALPGDIVRVVGNGGQDNDISTPADNFAYQVGVAEIGGGILPDGRHLDIPQGVTMMVDAGAAFKLRSSTVSVGSNNLLSDRSGGALQVLGTPTLLELRDPTFDGNTVTDPGLVPLGSSGNVVFTSTRDRSVDVASSGNSPAPSEGNWGGLIFRSDFDRLEGRGNLEDEGIFLQVVNHADIRFGGGSNILINSVQQTVNPIQIVDLRPTITFNQITNNASAAMSASPDAFLETRFQEPRFQQAGAFTADYGRIGPDIRQNLIVDNSINGLFIRTVTGVDEPARQITVAAHIDDVDVVHYIAENILIAGQPGGPIQDGVRPDVSSVSTQTTGGGSLPIGDIDYRLTFVDGSGFESLASDATASVTTDSVSRQIQLLNLPLISNGSDYLTRRLYRLDPDSGQYLLIAELNRSDATFVDDGSVAGGAILDLTRSGVRARLDGSLVIDPNTVVKFRGARIELDHGTQLLAEGTRGQGIVFTSALDDRFGAGGSFDTNEDSATPGGGALPARGDWSGIYASPTAHVSLDYAVIAYGGGVSLIEGGQSRGFAALELQQASARVTNSRFEYNDHGQDGSGPVGRNGRLAITPATIYGRFTQPVLVGNQFIDNHGTIIDLDLASMTDDLVIDAGRQTGGIERLDDLIDNHGPLIRRNTTDSEASPVAGERQLNGLRIRGGELVAGSVWDDTDIAHVLFESVVVGNYVSSGGLVLRSRPDESLVVKLAGRGTPNSDTAGTGITATGSTGDISDRIGGTVQVLGLPGAPVVLTSLKDDSVGAGRRIDGTAQNDTNGDSFGSRPSSNDWRSLFFDTLSNDRNLSVVLEQESSNAAPPGLNSSVQNAQILGDLAERLTASDEVSRLGFEVDGFISAPGDIDTYSFTAVAGTQIWVDVDKTSIGLDTVVEVIDDLGNVIARSDDSFVEIENESELDILDSEILAGPLGNADSPLTRRWSNGQYYDDASANLKDAGLRITLPGVVGTRSSYFVRVRSASIDPGDIAGGATSGAYNFQIRLREEQEFPGSVVRFADIRYANHGIHVQGLPGSSPLVGEAQENESVDPYSADARSQVFAPLTGGFGIEDEPRYGSDVYANNDVINGGVFAPFDFFNPSVINSRPQNLGDLVDSKTGTISVGGQLATSADVDFYQFDIDRAGELDDARRATIFDIDYADGFDRPDTNISVFYSPSGNPSTARLVLFGQSSNVLDDLNSPLSTQLAGELLERGSVSSNDPLIGPVALPAGSYFVAVTDAGRIPTQLTDNTRVRRSPVESTVRIFDDHVESIGGTTAEAPVLREFVDTTSAGWTITEERGNDQGHGRVSTFDSIASSTRVASSTPLVSNPGFFPQASQTVEGRTGNPPTELPIEIPESAYVADQLLLAFKDNVPDSARQLLLEREGLEITKSFQTISAVVVSTLPGVNIPDLAYRLSGMPEIDYAEPDFLMQPTFVPNDPLYPQQWHYDNVGQTGGTPGADISLEEAWDITTGDPNVVVAVIDSGIDLTHPDLVSSLWVNPGEIPGDGIDNDGNGYIDDINGIDPVEGDVVPQDIIGHGTHVAGTVGATGNNGIGVSGVNQNVSLMILRNCDIFCPQSASIESVEYATMMRLNHGINVVASNNSYGGRFPSIAAQQSIEAHNAAGILFVASSGNDGLNNDLFPHYPDGYDLEGILSVGASNDNDFSAGFSNVGAASVDIHAPGDGILSTTLGGTYGLNSGTSMASPHVAGVAGLLGAVAPNANLFEIKAAIMNGSDQLPQLDGLTVSGGRLNAFGAIQALPTTSSRNESYYFDRSEETGILQSTPFDLVGYTAEDLPRFYFDFFVQASRNDTITVSVTSDQQPNPITLPISLHTLTNTVWQQAVLDLGVVAGDTNIRVEFVYDVDTTETAEGLYLDNFIVGFAERGEMVADASFGQAQFTNPPTSIPGHYQLEIRPATEYTTTLPVNLLVERSLAADPLLIDPLYLQFTSGRGLTPYETFSIDVFDRATGMDEVFVFQFVPNDINLQDASLVVPGAVAIGYNVTDPEIGGTDSIINRVISAIQTLPGELSFYDIEPRTLQLTSSFDTNDRHGEFLTLVAPAASQISDGDTFVLGDGSRSITFEFSTDSSVAFGNIRVPFTAGMTSPEVARSMITVINSGVVQGTLSLRASTATGAWDFDNFLDPDAPPTDGRVALHGNAAGRFFAVGNVSEAPAVIEREADGSLRLAAIFHSGTGDRNTVRTQGAVVIENNQISEAHAIGIWSDPGNREVDPEDDRSFTVGGSYLQLPPAGNSQLGGVINFPELNDSVEGGVAPGVVIQNNIVDQAGYTGIKVDGETRPMVLEWNHINFVYASGNTLLQSPGDIMVADGFIFALDAGGTRVVFEFEDISGAPTNLGGSGVAGGDGFVDGHVPVYYRLGEGPTYNPPLPDPVRNVGSSVHEIMLSIYESIQGSILVTNGLVELVRPYIGPSLTGFSSPLQQSIDEDPIFPRPQFSDPTALDFLTPAVYLEGVTGIYASQAFQKQVGTGRSTMLNLERPFGGALELGTDYNSATGVASNSPVPMLPIAEAPQPLAKVVNNTVRGSDGTEGAVLEDGSLSPAIEPATAEPNETLINAVDPKLEVTHRGAYFATGSIGDNVDFLSELEDVDLFKVELNTGDRLIVDIDTADDGPATHLRVFDSSGIEVFVGQNGALPEYLNPGSTVSDPVLDEANDRDGFVDFTALAKDTYFVGVSSDGNEAYEAKSLAERVEGTGGTGAYELAIEVLAPRQFVFSLDSHPLDEFDAEDISGNINGTTANGGPAGARSLVGTTFTISQIPDYLIPTRPGDAYAGVNADGNRVTFEFTGGINAVVLPNGNINVPILNANFLGGGGYRVPDVMRAIANAVNGYLNNPAIPNHEVGNGPDGLDGPVTRVTAQALGGRYGDNVGIDNLTRLNGCTFESINCPFGIFGSVDYFNGFGHDRLESGGTNIVANGTLSDSQGTTELYTWIHNAAKIELSPEARAAGLRLGPDNTGLLDPRLGNASYATESDQLLAEQGIFVSSGVSAALLNNVVVNAHQSIVQEESSVFGFGGRIDSFNPDISPKQGSVVAAGNTFQYDDHRNTLIRSDVSWWVGFGGTINDNFALDGSLSTDLRTGPSNIAGGNSDFNFVVRHPDMPGPVPGGFTVLTGGDVLEDGAAGRFTPGADSAVIDSAVDSIDPLPEFVTLNAQLDIPTRLIASPDRDFSGQLRADEPTAAPPGGIGANVFKDRGALDRADFVGPAASLETPQDNDFAGTDFDPADSFVNRSEGIFTEFRILVQDLGDDSNPFVGSGIDGTTVIVPPIDGLRDAGANITLFENERLLEEGIDYTFSFDETRGVITLKALAGVWRNDRAYRIQLNNRDRTVLVSPKTSEINDGDQVTLVSNDGGTLIFEFEYGFLLEMPEAITLQIPRSGTNQGGLIDGGVFTIDDGLNPQVVFEFDSNGTIVPGSIPVTLPTQPTPIDGGERALFLEQIASNVVTAVQGVIDSDTPLNVDVRRDGTSIIVTSERDTRVDTSTSGLVIVPTTLGLQVPAAGADAGGVVVGDTFTVNDGQLSQEFQFTDGNNPAPAGVIGIDISPIFGTPPNAGQVADAILAAVNSSALDLDPTLVGRTVHLDLPIEGSADVPTGRLRPVSVSLTPTDGQLIEVTPVGSDTPVVFEINRTDEFIVGTGTINDGVTPGNIAIDINRQLTSNELAVRVQQVMLQTLETQPIDGLDPAEIRATGNGVLRLGGEEGLQISVTGDSIDLLGSPGVVGPSTLEVFGPLFLEIPFTAPGDGDQFTIFDDNGNPIVFEFDSNTILTDPFAERITISQFDDQDTVANAVVQAINASTAGITANNQGNGAVSLGRIGEDRVDATGSAVDSRRGIVTDAEFISITQGNSTVEYEFESVTNGGGVTDGRVPVPFQPGSTPLDVANSLAAAMSSNDGGLTFAPEVTAEGLVILNDVPGTVIDLSNAPSIILTGVPGGATPISIAPDDTEFDVNQAIISAINGLVPALPPVASDRGGATLFLEGGPQVQGPVESFFLPAIKDLSGNPLSPNREDNTTQFTLLLPTVGLDFGDAPDPRGIEPGRYASLLSNDGARHVVTPGLTLGGRVDAEPDSQTTLTADGDDLVISASNVGTLLSTSSFQGGVEIGIVSGIDPLTRDGDTVTLRVADRTVTLEFDTDGIFEESNFAIAPIDPTSTASILEAIEFAVRQSGLAPAGVDSTGGSVRVFSDDEDGVSFSSDTNPNGNLSKGINTPISVTVIGGGFLQAWIDFNADGDWDDPGELIIDPSLSTDAIFSDTGLPTTRVFDVTVPEFASPPNTAVSTYARFRISREGNLGPTGLALSGEVEDYEVALVPGTPPTIEDDQQNRTYSVQEDGALFVLDDDGQSTTTTNDDGLLVGIVDADGDAVGIFRDDTGPRQLFDDNDVFAGNLDLAADGTFTFLPAPDFNGPVSFTARVTEVKVTNPENELVNPNPITVTIDVVPVNDKPFATSTPVESSATTAEDTSITFLAADLIDPFYSPGPANEQDQTLVFQRVYSGDRGDSVSSQGGTLEITDGGRSVIYTPAQDYNGGPDEFEFIVADFAGTTVIPRSADVVGSVSITVTPVNDDPIAGPDGFGGQEDTNLTISIASILSNDVAGPANEVNPPESQTVTLVAGQFPVDNPIQTQRGGTVRQLNDDLIYTPPGLYSGPDTFTYRIVDSLGAEAVGTVTIDVGGENDAPVFEGVNGEKDIDNMPISSIELPESKPDDQSTVFNLDTWFSDPENDSLEFTVASSDESIVEVDLTGGVLTLTRKAFRFGQVNLTVTANDSQFTTSEIVQVNIVNENDPPEVIGPLDELRGDEDTTIQQSLSTIFSDPDNDDLNYVVARLGDLIRPTDAQIAAHPLIQSITLASGGMFITPQPNQSGSVEVEIEASDAEARVSDTFTVIIDPVADRPVAADDGYNVSVGSTLNVLNPANGLLRNDFDADGDPISVAPEFVGTRTTTFGEVTVNEDGTFVYVNRTGELGQVDSFTYQIVDDPTVGQTQRSEVRTVTLTLNQSQYQNPIEGLEEDVNADGFVSPIDALRIINFLSRRAPASGAVPVSDIGAPPPDYYDTDGNGFVSPADALRVINRLATLQGGNGEGEGFSDSLRSASGVSFASLSTDFLPSLNTTTFGSTSGKGANRDEGLSDLDTTDALFGAGIDVQSSGSSERIADVIADGSSASPSSDESIDDVLGDLVSELESDLGL